MDRKTIPKSFLQTRLIVSSPLVLNKPMTSSYLIMIYDNMFKAA